MNAFAKAEIYDAPVAQSQTNSESDMSDLAARIRDLRVASEKMDDCINRFLADFRAMAAE